MKRLFILLLLVPCLVSLGQETLPSEYNCFTVLVGKDASVEGTVLYGHNDDDGFQLVNMYVEPRKDYPRGAKQTLQHGGQTFLIRSPGYSNLEHASCMTSDHSFTPAILFLVRVNLKCFFSAVKQRNQYNKNRFILRTAFVNPFYAPAV